MIALFVVALMVLTLVVSVQSGLWPVAVFLAACFLVGTVEGIRDIRGQR